MDLNINQPKIDLQYAAARYKQYIDIINYKLKNYELTIICNPAKHFILYEFQRNFL